MNLCSVFCQLSSVQSTWFESRTIKSSHLHLSEHRPSMASGPTQEAHWNSAFDPLIGLNCVSKQYTVNHSICFRKVLIFSSRVIAATFSAMWMPWCLHDWLWWRRCLDWEAPMHTFDHHVFRLQLWPRLLDASLQKFALGICGVFVMFYWPCNSMRVL